jgi:hypothetical protein
VTTAVSRAEIARAVPAGSRRARSQRDFLRAALAAVELEQLRPDAAERMLEVARILARFASWSDRTTRPGRALICKLAGISVTTYKRCRRRWAAWGYLGTVREGTTAEFASFLHRDDPNQAPVYVLAIPRRKPMTAQVRDPGRTSGPPPQSARTVEKVPARGAERQTRGRPPSGRTQPGSAAAPSGAAPADAMARVLRRAGGKTITEGWCAWLARPFAATWSPADLAWAIDHDPAGAQHRWTGKPRHPVGWMRSRLAIWLDAGGKPLPSRSQQLAASRDRIARDRRRTRRAIEFLQTSRARDRSRARLARASLEEDRARLRQLPGDLGQRGAQLARQLIDERQAQIRERSRCMDFYDSTEPAKIPAGSHACLYYDGEYAASEFLEVGFAAVRWITVTGDWEHCGIADFEKGNPVFSVDDALRTWVQGRLANGHRARVYCDRDNLPEVQEQLEGLKWELWVATLDGDVLSADWAPNLWAVQYGGGEHAPYDKSILYGQW